MKEERYPGRQHSLSCVVPCFNAEDVCCDVVAGIKQHISNIIVVNDGSTDGTAEALASADVTTVTHRQNLGKGVALVSGFKKALEDPNIANIVTIDADFQHNPADIPKLLQGLPLDLIIGHRFHRRIANQPLRRRFSNAFSNAVLSYICKRPILDSQSGFRIYSRHLAEYLIDKLEGRRFEWETEALIKAARAGYSITFIPISTHYPEDLNSSFHPIWDSLRVVATFFK